MPLPLLAAADLTLSLTPTADLQHTFVEHEDLKAILLAGQNHFDIQSVCDVRAGTGPTLVLSSAGDRLVNPLCSTRLAAAWQTAHAQHPWAGHDLPHDDGEWVCRQLGSWISG